MTLDDFRSLTDPSRLSPALQALWWEGRGDWDRAHDLAQKAGGSEGDAVHAYLHRKEGDAANASYWYTRARRSRFTGSVEDEWQALVREFLSRGPSDPR